MSPEKKRRKKSQFLFLNNILRYQQFNCIWNLTEIHNFFKKRKRERERSSQDSVWLTWFMWTMTKPILLNHNYLVTVQQNSPLHRICLKWPLKKFREIIHWNQTQDNNFLISQKWSELLQVCWNISDRKFTREFNGKINS